MTCGLAGTRQTRRPTSERESNFGGFRAARQHTIAAKEFKEAGDDVRLIFDGAATQWPGVLADDKHKAHRLYDSVADVGAGAWGYCAGAFHAKESLHHAKVRLMDEYEGHPSSRRLLADGYQVLSF